MSTQDEQRPGNPRRGDITEEIHEYPMRHFLRSFANKTVQIGVN